MFQCLLLQLQLYSHKYFAILPIASYLRLPLGTDLMKLVATSTLQALLMQTRQPDELFIPERPRSTARAQQIRAITPCAHAQRGVVREYTGSWYFSTHYSLLKPALTMSCRIFITATAAIAGISGCQQP